MAGRAGFEPTFSESKSDVLPLHHLPIKPSRWAEFECDRCLGVGQFDTDRQGGIAGYAEFSEIFALRFGGQHSTVKDEGCSADIDVFIFQGFPGCFIFTDYNGLAGVRG